MRRLSIPTCIALSVAIGILACVGDDPSTSSSSGDLPDGSAADGATTGDGSSGGTCKGDTVDACGTSCTKCVVPKDGRAECTNGACAKVCDGGKVACGDACVDTSTSADHCGQCGHSCAGGECVAKVCQPLQILGGLTNTHAFDVSPTHGVIVAADKDIVRCDIATGCTDTTRKAVATGFTQLADTIVSGNELFFVYQFGDFSRLVKCGLPTGCPAPAAIDANIVDDQVNRYISRLAVTPTRLVYAIRSYNGPFINACNLPGCASPTTVRPEQASATATDSDAVANKTITTLGASGTMVLYGSSVYGVGGVSVRSCAFPSCTTPTNVGVGSGGTAEGITFQGGKFYFATSDNGSDAIWSVADGATTKTSLSSDAPGVSDLAVDASGIYWANATTGKIQKCALAGCGGGTLLASGQAGASRIRVDASFVYWMTPTAVFRLAK